MTLLKGLSAPAVFTAVAANQYVPEVIWLKVTVQFVPTAIRTAFVSGQQFVL